MGGQTRGLDVTKGRAIDLMVRVWLYCYESFWREQRNMRLAIAHSVSFEANEAAQSLIQQLDHQLGGETPQAGLLFAAIDLEHQLLLRELTDRYRIPFIGCTTDGEMTSSGEFQEDSCCVGIFAGDDMKVTAALGRNISADHVSAASEIRKQCDANLTPCMMIATPEAVTTSSVGIMTALQHEFGRSFPIFGGLAADQWRFKQTVQFFERETLTDALPVLIFYGNLKLGFGVASGWKPMGEKRQVTQSDSHVVLRIGDQTATDFYGYYLGGGGEPLGEYPLAVFEDGHEFYLRAPLQVDMESECVAFAGDVPEGAAVQITHATRDSILEAARASVEQAKRTYPGSRPAASILISCAARKQLLGTRTVEEFRLARAILGESIPIIGFYAYGEMSPLSKAEPSRFHNETFVTLIMGQE